LEERNRAGRELDLHTLRGKSLQRKYEAAVAALQDACPHEVVNEQVKYFTGGYDYCASTVTNVYCKTCGFLVDTREDVHHGRYG